MSEFDPRWSDDVRDGHERHRDGGGPAVGREVPRGGAGSSGQERERVYGLRESYMLRGSESRTLASVGALRVVPGRQAKNATPCTCPARPPMVPARRPRSPAMQGPAAHDHQCEERDDHLRLHANGDLQTVTGPMIGAMNGAGLATERQRDSLPRRRHDDGRRCRDVTHVFGRPAPQAVRQGLRTQPRAVGELRCPHHGERLLMVRRDIATTPATLINVVPNWLDESQAAPGDAVTPTSAAANVVPATCA